MIHVFKDPKGNEWSAHFAGGWVSFERADRMRSIEGPAEELLFPTDEELAALLKSLWEARKAQRAMSDQPRLL